MPKAVNRLSNHSSAHEIFKSILPLDKDKELIDILSDDKRAGVCKCLMSNKVGLISKEAILGVYISVFSVAKAIKPKFKALQ